MEKKDCHLPNPHAPSMQLPGLDASAMLLNFERVAALYALQGLHKLTENGPPPPGFAMNVALFSPTQPELNSAGSMVVGDPGQDFFNLQAYAAAEVQRHAAIRMKGGVDAAVVKNGSKNGACIVAFDKVREGRDVYIGISARTSQQACATFAVAFAEMTGLKVPAFALDELGHARDLFFRLGVVFNG